MESEKPNTTETLKQHESFCLSGILEIAAAATIELSKATQRVYLDKLSSLTRESFQHAAARTISEWDRPSMMPPLAFILARVPENSRVEAEAAWELLQQIVYRDWHPDVGWSRKVELSAQMEYVIRQCGGLQRIHDCPTDTFSFLRRDFLEAWARFTSEGGEQLRISTTRAQEILGPLYQTLGEQKRLPPTRHAIGFTQVAKPEKPKPVQLRQLTAEEYETRMKLLREQAEKLKSTPAQAGQA